MYHVLATDHVTMISDSETGLRVQVTEKDNIALEESASYCVGTMFRTKAGLTPEKVFVFLALSGADLELLKDAVDFFFLTLLETELYVKEVPRESGFFDEEALRIHGKEIFETVKH